jgi:hypothetical protein
MHWSEVQVGDEVTIKGVRSHINGRHRESGTVTHVIRDSKGRPMQVEVDCGTVVRAGERASSLIVKPRA